MSPEDDPERRRVPYGGGLVLAIAGLAFWGLVVLLWTLWAT